MRCPYCSSDDTQVKDSRPSEDNSVIRRRRHCSDCSGRFTTFERVQLRELTVLKNDGTKEPFDRDKLIRSMSIPLRKRPIDSERLEKIISRIVRELEQKGDNEVPSLEIGRMVMETFAEIDQIAYVRYASVYKDFREVSDFREFLGDIPKAADMLDDNDDFQGNLGHASEITKEAS
jgi:transcriptional repressor NrdR